MLHSRRRTLRSQRMLGSGDFELFVQGGPPCVVAFHGFGGTAAELRPLLDRIAEAGFAIDAALLPGHGLRAEALQAATFEEWLAAGRRRVAAAVATHRTAVLVGFSLGSLVALQIASERPDGVAGVVVLGNALTLSRLARVPLGLLARLGGAIPDLYLVKPRAADIFDETAMESIVTYDRHPLRAAVEVYRAGRRVRAAVTHIECPALILHGRRDFVCPWRNATWLADNVGARDVTLRIFEQSAHVLACDGERGDVAREVIAFLLAARDRTTAPSGP